MNRTRRRTARIGLALLTLGLQAATVLAWESASHTQLSADAYALLSPQGQTPDIVKFSRQFIGNSSGYWAEIAAHGGPNAFDPLVLTRDGGPFDDWIDQIVSDYKSGDFQKTYTEVGSLVHLAEDQNVPAHAANISHGFPWPDNFEVQADDSGAPIFAGWYTSGAIATPTISQMPELLISYEGLVSTNRGLNTSTYLIPGTTSSYWVNGAGSYVGLIDVGTDGSYGGFSLSCSDPNTCTVFWGQDVFDDSADTLSPHIVLRQATSARSYTAGLLNAISGRLPPFASQLTIGGAGLGGAPPVINAQSGTDVSFFVTENRTQDMTATVSVQETGDRILTDAASIGLDGQICGQPNGQTWNQNHFTLCTTDSSDLTQLPLAAQLHLTWKGTVAGGGSLKDGTYTLCVTVTDGDNNTFPNTTQGDPPQCQSFLSQALRLAVESGRNRMNQSAVADSVKLSAFPRRDTAGAATANAGKGAGSVWGANQRDFLGSERPSCLVLQGALACAAVAGARPESAQDRGVMRGRCQLRGEADQPASASGRPRLNKGSRTGTAAQAPGHKLGRKPRSAAPVPDSANASHSVPA